MEIFGFHFNFFLALDELPNNVSTSAGLKYFLLHSIMILPFLSSFSFIPFSLHLV